MTCQALVQRNENDGYRAQALGLPECVATGASREEALANLRAAVTAHLAAGEIVPLEFEGFGNPWARWAGAFQDDSTFDDLLNEITLQRSEEDARENAGGAVPA